MTMIKKILYGFFSILSGLLPVNTKNKIIGSNWSHLFRSILNKTVPPGLSEVVISAGPLKGKKILLDMHNEKSRWLGTYEPELVEAVRTLVQPGMTIYDVGANIGYVSMIFADAVGDSGKVLAFEPLPENAARIQYNVHLNTYPNIWVYEYAVIDAEKPVIFYRHRSPGMGKAAGSAGRTDQSYEETITVHGINLDNFIFEKENPVPQLVKIDIEGGEVLAIPGMRRLLSNYSPTLLIELHGEESEQVAWRILSELEYELFQMDDLSIKIENTEKLKWKAYVVAIKKRK